MLSDLLEKYQESEDKQVVLDEFLDKLWSSKYVFKKRKKTQVFEVHEESLNNRQDLIDMFNQYNVIEYMYCQSFYKGDLDSIDYIRVHINNMYGYLIDPHVYLPKDYYQLIWTSKQEYFEAIELLKQGEKVDVDPIEQRIKDSFVELDKIKGEAKKIDLKFSEYKKLINSYIERIFNNYVPIHEYEEEHGWEMRVTVDGWSEDNFIISYFCKSLTGYMRNYTKSLQPKEIIKKCCVSCDKEITVNNGNQKYCDNCLIKRTKERRRINNQKYYNKIKTTK